MLSRLCFLKTILTCNVSRNKLMVKGDLAENEKAVLSL